MAFKKATGGGSQAPRKPPSQGRIKAYIQRTDDGAPGASGPSTLPPPPFESETAVEDRGWWLDAHMNLASQVLWLEQQVDPEAPPSSNNVRSAHLEPIRTMVESLASVRDALYELYCDGADARLAPRVQAGSAVDALVRGTYAWCTAVVDVLAAMTTALRSSEEPDWNAVHADCKAADGLYPSSVDGVRREIAALGVDFKSPVEPLRFLPSDLDALDRHARELRTALGRRFG